MMAAQPDVSWVFVELGSAVIGLALLARAAHRLGFSAIPLYLLGGLAFGKGGLLPLQFSAEFIHIGAEIGVILLLFMLGLEYTGEELKAQLRTGLAAGVADLLLNFPPGFIAGLVYGWGTLPAAILGGVTYISSSGIMARVLSELGRMNNPETPTILSILVLEDLAMAVFLPLVAVLVIGQGIATAAVSVAIALVTVGGVLLLALRYGNIMSRIIAHGSDEVILLSTLGLVLVVAGVAQHLRVSAAVGAFLAGIALSGPIVKQTQRTLGPLRDLFAAFFFLFFGLEIDPAALPAVLVPAMALGLVTALTKLLTGWWAARRAGLDTQAGLGAGAALVARGEFSIVIAALGENLEPKLGPLAAAYVLLLAVLAPLLVRLLGRRAEARSPIAE